MTRLWTDRELYAAFGQDGSEQQRQAFEVLYQELYAISFFMLQTTRAAEPQALAQDCTQEALVKVWKHLDTCEQPDSVRGWAKTIVRNQTLNEIARLKRKAESSLEQEIKQPLADQNEAPSAAFDDHEKQLAILDLLAAAPISERSRYVILAKYLLQMSEAEISEALSQREGLAIKPSHVQVTRAKNIKKLIQDADLREKFRKLHDEG
ncbi:MAG: RNA polymerase sigma factor [Chloroflexota bacterium]|nr:RNA polymerase sigma factor [Chloroflexota bacterium]